MTNFMRCERDFEFTHEGHDYLVEYIVDAHVGKSWITWIYDQETGNRIYPEHDTDGWSRQARVTNELYEELKPVALAAMENAETSRAEKAHEQAFSDYHGGSGPMSLTEQYAAAWLEKRRLRG